MSVFQADMMIGFGFRKKIQHMFIKQVVKVSGPDRGRPNTIDHQKID